MKLLYDDTVINIVTIYITLYEKIFSVANNSLQVSTKRKTNIKITILSI